VIQVMQRLVGEIPSSNEHKGELQLFLNTIAPSVIDMVATAAKGKLSLSTHAASFWRGLLGCCRRQN